MIDCPLCEIADGARASFVLANRPYACAVVDEDAPAPGRVIVVPRPHVSRISELSDAQATELMMLARDVAVALEDGNIALEGVVAEAGNDAVDEESHLRITVIPRMSSRASERQHVISDDVLEALRRALA